MAAADCPICAALGYRSCDKCGTPVFEPIPGGPDICGYCQESAPTTAGAPLQAEGERGPRRRRRTP